MKLVVEAVNYSLKVKKASEKEKAKMLIDSCRGKAEAKDLETYRKKDLS